MKKSMIFFLGVLFFQGYADQGYADYASIAEEKILPLLIEHANALHIAERTIADLQKQLDICRDDQEIEYRNQQETIK